MHTQRIITCSSFPYSTCKPVRKSCDQNELLNVTGKEIGAMTLTMARSRMEGEAVKKD